MMLRVLSLSAGILLSTLGLAAAQNATLVADTISFDGANRLVASGAVEVLYGSTRLKASRVVYNQATDKLSIEGPLTLVDGDTIVVADEAEISQDLRDGVLESARVVLAEQLQLAATEVSRVSGRYTQLYKVAVTSCHVCGADDLPLAITGQRNCARPRRATTLLRQRSVARARYPRVLSAKTSPA